MKKKLLSILLVLSMMLALVPAAFAAERVDGGYCGDGVTWVLNDEGGLTIAGSGQIRDYSKTDPAPWKDTAVKDVVISEGVTAVGAYAFADCTEITSVQLPSTLTTLGEWCFAGCISLISVELPHALMSVIGGAFADCLQLREFSMDGGGNNKYTVRDGVLMTTDGTGLVAYPAARPGIRYDVPDGVRYIYGSAFSGSGLAVVSLPTSMYYVENYAFSNCTRLMYIGIPAEMDYMGEQGVFAGDDQLKEIYYTGTQEQWQRMTMPCFRLLPAGATVYYETQMNVTTAADVFADVSESSWSFPGIDFCYMMDYMSGTGEGRFSPLMTTTRAQVVQILYNFAGEPAVTGETKFTDLTQDWYKNAVLWAYQTGVVAGTSATTFSPNDPVTREQIAVMFLEFAAKVLGMHNIGETADLSAFPDGGSVSGWARDAMADAVALSLISGVQTPDGTFLRPQNSATREQVATILMQFYADIDAALRVEDYLQK